jgi:SAM-dependent methyltransferase
MVNIYDYPELYFSLFEPEQLIQKWAEKNLHHYFPNGVDNFLEPACGPGFWIKKIKPKKFLGIDINPKTIEWAKQNSEIKEGEFLVGDMRNLEKFTQNKFDLVLNLESTIGHFHYLEDVVKHLKSVRKVITENGYYFLGVPLLNEYFQEEINLLSYKANPVKLKSGGEGTLEMKSSFANQKIEDILRLTYSIEIKDNPLYPKNLVCSYDLKSFDANEITKIIEDSKFKICQANYMQFPDNPSSKTLYNLGLVSLVLKPQ